MHIKEKNRRKIMIKREYVTYTCEICQRVHKLEEKCDECEKGHVKPRARQPIRKARYEHGDKKKYPSSVLVTMEDGKIMEFFRRGDF